MKQARFIASPFLCAFLAIISAGCRPAPIVENEPGEAPPILEEGLIEPQFSLSTEATHNRFSASIPPTLTVPSGAIVEIHTKEASDGQLSPTSSSDDVLRLDFDPIHPLTGPIFVEGAEPGDVLRVELHTIELGDWGWTAITPGFGLLAGEFSDPYIKTFRFSEGDTHADFGDGIQIPLAPFAGVMGVAPATNEHLSTIPPRANGGNMDNRHMVEGTTVYFPIFVQGALFSIGDTHAAQGDGEVCGTAIEAPMRIVAELTVIKGQRAIAEPQYETDEFYAVTAFAGTLDEAAIKATRFMIDYLEAERSMARQDAYALASVAADLKISEVVDVPHVLVSMHIRKDIFP